MRNRWLLFILGMLSFGSLSGTETTLESIKKGEEGEKSWAVLKFSDSTPWLGISQVSENQVSFYFEARAGDVQSTTSLSGYYPREITVRQIKEYPPLLKMDIRYETGAPLSVIKKNGHLIVAINDKLLTEGTLAVKESQSFNPGELVNVETVEQDGKTITTLHFEGDFSLSGYIRPSGDAAALMIQNANLSIPNTVYTFEGSALNTIRFVESGSSIKAVLFFDTMKPFSVAQRPHKLMLQMESIQKQEANILTTDVKKASPEVIGTADVDSTTGLTAVQEEEEPLSVQEKKEEKTKPFEAAPDSAAPSGKDDSYQQEESDIPWDQKFNFRFNSTPINEALRTIGVAHGLNLVIQDGGEDVKITMDLNDVTLRQALNKILHTHDYEYYEEDGIITVHSLKAKFKGGSYTKLFRLKYADAENVAKVIKRVVTNDSLVQVFYPEFLQYDGAGKSRQEAGKVAVQGIRRSSTLVVTDRPERIREVTRIIKDLDRAPVQFLVHSKLIEAAPMNTSQLGINWDKTISAALWSTNIDAARGMEAISAINTSPGQGGQLTLGHLTASKFEAVLDFLREKTDSKLKSNPSIMAMDNEESSISVGTTVPVPIIRRGMAGQGDMVTFEYKEVNIQLNVMPHLAENGEITMYVNPIIEEITDWVEYEEHRAPITSKRAVNAIVNVKHGETVVIGGLIRSQKVTVLKKVWLLGSIPLIGKLFQHEKTEEKQTDLMIFITPTIVKSG